METFENGSCPEERLKNVLNTAVETTHYMIKVMDLPDIEVRVSKKRGCYHRGRRPGEHIIVYGAATFDPRTKHRACAFVISKGNIMKVSATRITTDLQIMAVVIEETAHYLQVLNHGRHYGSVHNGEFFRQFKILWDKFSDELLPKFQNALDQDGIQWRR